MKENLFQITHFEFYGGRKIIISGFENGVFPLGEKFKFKDEGEDGPINFNKLDKKKSLEKIFNTKI